jgi:transcriptional regulator with XRE-family HTH domain
VLVERQAQHRNDAVIKQLGSRIREERLKAGLSQQEFADICNLELSQINRIELGKINTSVSHLFLIAEKLGVTPQELISFK